MSVNYAIMVVTNVYDLVVIISVILVVFVTIITTTLVAVRLKGK